MAQTREEWLLQAQNRGTSGDMVFDILRDWKASENDDLELIRDSFNRGYEKGMRKVVEWACQTCPHGSDEGTRTFKRVCDSCWQVFLKENGL